MHIKLATALDDIEVTLDTTPIVGVSTAVRLRHQNRKDLKSLTVVLKQAQGPDERVPLEPSFWYGFTYTPKSNGISGYLEGVFDDGTTRRTVLSKLYTTSPVLEDRRIYYSPSGSGDGSSEAHSAAGSRLSELIGKYANQNVVHMLLSGTYGDIRVNSFPDQSHKHAIVGKSKNEVKFGTLAIQGANFYDSAHLLVSRMSGTKVILEKVQKLTVHNLDLKSSASSGGHAIFARDAKDFVVSHCLLEGHYDGFMGGDNYLFIFNQIKNIWRDGINFA